MTGQNRRVALLEWYGRNKRDLPWRDANDPYATLVSESMLQQTQVERVIPKFNVFISEWPTIEDLASADDAALLAAWSGLGYNSRVLRLKKAAGVVAAHGWPTSVGGLRELPGVGPYTATAIASIAFGKPIAAVDTNVKRVLSRWVGEPLAGAELAAVAAEELGSPAGDWNQAVMDLGSTLCRPRKPLCNTCPVSEWCSDPAIYEPPPRQSPFKGSHRELRGALVHAQVTGQDLWMAGRAMDRSDDEISAALDALRNEGLLINS